MSTGTAKMKPTLIVIIVVWLWFAVLNLFDRFALYGGRFSEYVAQLKGMDSINSLATMPYVTVDYRPESGARPCRRPVSAFEDSDCPVVCQDPEAVLRRVTETEIVINEQRQLQPGYYCLLSDASTCNKYTTILVYTADGWSCANRFAEFQGNGGNKIMVCNGELYDNLFNRLYRSYIPSNLVLDGPDEKLPDGRSYRFTCLDTHDPQTYNRLISPDKARLIQIQNPCTIGIKNPMEISYSFSDNICSCVTPLYTNRDRTRCIACKTGYDNQLRNVVGGTTSYNLPIDCWDYNLPEFANDGAGNYQVLLPCLEKNCFDVPVGLYAGDSEYAPAARDLIGRDSAKKIDFEPYVETYRKHAIAGEPYDWHAT